MDRVGHVADGEPAEVPFARASKRSAVHLCARRHVSVPESNFLIRVAPSKPAKLVPFQAGDALAHMTVRGIGLRRTYLGIWKTTN